MTTTAAGRSQTSACNGATLSFPVSFRFRANADLRVYLLDSATAANESGTLLIEGADYAVSGDGRTGSASVVTTSAWPAGKYLRRYRVTSMAQDADFVPGDGLSAETLEGALDRLAMVDEEIDAARAGGDARALRVPDGETVAPFAAASDRANAVSIGFSGLGALLLFTAAKLATALAPHLPAGLRGDPGANVMAIGAFETAATLTVPAGTNMVQTSSWRADARVGSARYHFLQTGNDAAYQAANPRTSFISANGRLFAIAEDVLRHTHFGCYADDYDGNGHDDSDAFEAFFAHGNDDGNAARFVYDFSHGRTKVRRGMFMGRTAPTNNEIHRTYVAGTITVPRTHAELPGSAPIVDVLTICGTRHTLIGKLHIDGRTPGGFDAYANRRFRNGVRLYHAAYSTFGRIQVDCGRRAGVVWDKSVGPFTSADGRVFAWGESNNIACTFESIQARATGSYHASSGHGHAPTFTIASQGGMISGGSTYETNAAAAAASRSYAGSLFQRSRLTLSTAAELEEGDWGWTNFQAAPADFGTVTCDNAAGTITFTGAQPAFLAKLKDGDQILLLDATGVGLNDGYFWKVVSGAGTATLTVFSEVLKNVAPWKGKPRSEAAIAYSGLSTEPCYAQIITKSGNDIYVRPWVADRDNSAWHSCHGSTAKVVSRNAANTRIGLLTTLIGGVGLWAGGLYAPKIDSFLPEYSEIGAIHGDSHGNNSLGFVISHIHAEASRLSFLMLAAQAGNAILSGGSNFSAESVMAVAMRQSTAEGPPAAASLANVTADSGGCPVIAGPLYTMHVSSFSVFGNATNPIPLTNAPNVREANIHADSGTCFVEYNETIGERYPGNNWARLYWQDTDGTAPDGTATFELTYAMVQRGWQIVAPSLATVNSYTSTQAGAGGPWMFFITFNRTTRRVHIHKVAYA